MQRMMGVDEPDFGHLLAATDHVVPAIELIDSRIRAWRIGIADTIADNASSGRFILGNNRFDPRDVDLSDVNVALYAGFGGSDVLIAQGNTSAVLGHPANAVAWLANTLAGYGMELEAGHIILSGSCTRAVDVAKGDHIRASVDGLGEVFVEIA